MFLELLCRLGKNLASVLLALREHRKNKTTIPDLFAETASRCPNKTAIIFEEQKWTFRELDEFTNRVANHFRSLGLQKGDCVALFADNCPEYIGVYLGLGKLGVVTAFINNHLQHEALIHCVKIVTPRAIVFHSSLSDVVQAVLPDLDPALSDTCYSICGESPIPQAKSLEAEIEGTSAQPPPPPPDKSFEGNHIFLISYVLAAHQLWYSHMTDKLCYIYTSGTTGLPKACNMKNYRLVARSIFKLSFFNVDVPSAQTFKSRCPCYLYFSLSCAPIRTLPMTLRGG